MSKREVLVDDIDGSEHAVETVTFGINGNMYEIDLSRENQKELRKALARYERVARPTRLRSGKPKNGAPASSLIVKATRKATGKATGKAKSGPAASQVREWARENGIDVTPTGRVPQSLVDQYVAANK
jgi:hypothetical protein